jgi:23S rRNA (uracil1939-C5)-methyltransferase
VGIDLSLEIQGIATLTSEQRDELIAFAQKHHLARFVFRYRKTIDTLHMIARPTVMFAGIPIETDAYSFLQATDEADAFLEAFILANVDDDAKSILDLFCGRGTLSFPLSKKAPVVGYEFDKPALAALEKGAPLSIHPIVAHYRDLFEDPLSYAELTPFDTIVIDPPRAGAENQVRSIAKSHAKTVIYVSCNPETFARDAAILTQSDGAFSLEFVHALDQFAWSPHVEVLAVFKRKK